MVGMNRANAVHRYGNRTVSIFFFFFFFFFFCCWFYFISNTATAQTCIRGIIALELYAFKTPKYGV